MGDVRIYNQSEVEFYARECTEIRDRFEVVSGAELTKI